jgi:hypothetical protein
MRSRLRPQVRFQCFVLPRPCSRSVSEEDAFASSVDPDNDGVFETYLFVAESHNGHESPGGAELTLD